jgi:hypothetical protein
MKIEQKVIFRGNGNVAIGTFILEIVAGKVESVWVKKPHWIPFMSTTIPVLGNVSKALDNFTEAELVDVLHGRTGHKVREYSIDIRTGQVFTPELPLVQVKEKEHLRMQLEVLESKLQEAMEMLRNMDGGDMFREKMKDMYDFVIKDLKPPVVVMNKDKKKGED